MTLFIRLFHDTPLLNAAVVVLLSVRHLIVLSVRHLIVPWLYNEHLHVLLAYQSATYRVPQVRNCWSINGVVGGPVASEPPGHTCRNYQVWLGMTCRGGCICLVVDRSPHV
jgi:hypothetical protein